MYDRLLLLALALWLAAHLPGAWSPAFGWTLMDSGTDPHLWAVYGFAPDDIMAVGGRGTIIRFDGQQWTEMTSSSPVQLYQPFGLDPNRWWAVGMGHTIHSYDSQALYRPRAVTPGAGTRLD